MRRSVADIGRVARAHRRCIPLFKQREVEHRHFSLGSAERDPFHGAQVRSEQLNLAVVQHRELDAATAVQRQGKGIRQERFRHGTDFQPVRRPTGIRSHNLQAEPLQRLVVEVDRDRSFTRRPNLLCHRTGESAGQDTNGCNQNGQFAKMV